MDNCLQTIRRRAGASAHCREQSNIRSAAEEERRRPGAKLNLRPVGKLDFCIFNLNFQIGVLKAPKRVKIQAKVTIHLPLVRGAIKFFPVQFCDLGCPA